MKIRGLDLAIKAIEKRQTDGECMEKITPNDIKLFFMWVLHKLNIKHKWITINYHNKD